MEDLETIILRAKERGWNQLKEYPNISVENLAHDIASHQGQERKLLFQHEFAKAYFDKGAVGFVDEYVCADPSCSANEIKWKYHLQNAVISKDPIQYYLENFK